MSTQNLEKTITSEQFKNKYPFQVFCSDTYSHFYYKTLIGARKRYVNKVIRNCKDNIIGFEVAEGNSMPVKIASNNSEFNLIMPVNVK